MMEIRAKTIYYNENFIKARCAKGFVTKVSLSNATGISYQTIVSYENFLSYPSDNSNNTKILESGLSCPYEYLFPIEYRKLVDLKLGRKREIVKEISFSQLSNNNINMLSYNLNDNCLDIIDKEDYIKNKLKKHLTEQEENVLICRFGLNGGGEKTLNETSKILKISRERIRQVENKALNKLKHQSSYLDEYRYLFPSKYQKVTYA